MNQNRRLLEETTRMKKLMSIKNDEVILEQSTKSVEEWIRLFSNSTKDETINTINRMDKSTFFNFIRELIKRTGKDFGTHINSKFSESDGEKIIRLQQLLKSKFNVESDTSLTGTQYMNARQRVFKKKFRITNFNLEPSQQQAGYTQTMRDEDSRMNIVTKTGPNATDFVVTKPGETPPPEWKPEQAKKETTTSSPQTYNDVLSGKGILKTGVTSPAVGELQQKLIDLGYSAIAKPTNYFGTQTFNAVKDFQEKNSLTPDGKVGGNTSKKIDEILANKNKTTDNTSKSAEPTTTPNDRVLRSAVQSYVPKGVSRTVDFS